MDDFLLLHLQRLSTLETIIGYSFTNKELLRQALTHKSFANENATLGLLHNESLEFLGDSVLGFVISTSLYARFPGHSEGDLSRFRSYLVSGEHLVRLARTLQLGDFLLLGRGEHKTQGRQKKNILTDSLEALIAAVYLDGGIRHVRTFINRIFHDAIKNLEAKKPVIHDYKTRLQEYLAESRSAIPRYTITGEEGPDHEKTFYAQIEVNGEVLGSGEGTSKKQAQQMAAREAMEKLAKLDPAKSREE